MSDDHDDFQECERCHESYLLRDGEEPTRLCDHCAHLENDDLRIKLAAVEAELSALREDKARLEEALKYRNSNEDKAHALFTLPISNGQTFAHAPEQCNPLGFVKILRSAYEALATGKHVANPFILNEYPNTEDCVEVR